MPITNGLPLPRLPQIAVEDFDVRRRSLALMRELTIRPDVRARLDEAGLRDRRNHWLRTDGRRGVEIAAQEMALLLSAGATRGDVMLYSVFLEELIEEFCDQGAAGGDRIALELEHMRLDAAEDALQGRALVEVETPDELLERARALRKEAAAGLALARALEGRVRRRTIETLRRTG